MKKLSLIIILTFFINLSVDAKEIYLNCESYKLISHRTNGKIEIDKGFPMEQILRINNVKKKVFKFMDAANIFMDISHENLKWKKEVITWDNYLKKLSEGHGGFTVYSTLNRLNLELLQSTVYENDKFFKKIDAYYKCKIIDKKI